MKHICLTLLFMLSALSCFAQSMFFDNLNNSTWSSASTFNDSTFRNSKEIPLGKLNFPTDSLKNDITIWNFQDNALTIYYFDHILRRKSLMNSYKYEIDLDKGILKIVLNDNTKIFFSVGIVSTGNFALLIREQKKRNE